MFGVVCGRVHVSSAQLEKSEPKLYTNMPNTTINSLKKENDKLKDEIAALRKSFGDLQQLLQRHDESPVSDGGHTCSLNTETSTNLEICGKSYDDLKVSQAETDEITTALVPT